MELKDSVIIRNSAGAVRSGLAVTYRKYGDTTGGVLATETTTGKYEVTIPDTYIAKYYDVWITGGDYNPYLEKVHIGEWIWHITDYDATDGAEISYSDLTDDNGDALPATIPDPVVLITHKDGRLVYARTVGETSFYLHLSKAGDSADHTVDITIKVGI